MMFIFMPSVFPQEFTLYIGQIISPILRALADENEFVRDTAYKAGQRFVDFNFTKKNTSIKIFFKFQNCFGLCRHCSDFTFTRTRKRSI